jgi:formylglycine-generating enzyme required for sulfatase activity
MANQGGWESAWNASLVVDPAALRAAVNCSGSYSTWTDVPGANEALPINCITWYEAFAFCTWDGGFLPTEAEWNYAAAGSEQRAYPWSNPPSSVTIDCSYANFDPGAYCVNAPMGSVNRVGSESPKGDGPWGQSDLAGNVAEWTLDWYATTYSNPCDDCAALTPTSLRILRGGYFPADANGLRGALRYNLAPDARLNDVGVRCARTP